ncbi:Aste57867_25047 [Aphanomyces stellatus]|uniref:Aste57867_25047 protein n=1 Tax=Aphanomyces stellatus TaxID=120398 RepID=A0A485LWI3_9STRA|nr:hypothetical protein As57867_024969 [Aphanomyces stellatus]VFU01678.1 Aste57867_25047 [Aphanomyces stellatus]
MLVQDATWKTLVGGPTRLERWIYHTSTLQLRSDRFGDCLDAYWNPATQAYAVHTWWCDSANPNQKWVPQAHLLRHASSKLCLVSMAAPLVRCNGTDPAQFWTTSERVYLSLPWRQRVSVASGRQIVQEPIPEDFATWMLPNMQWIVDYDTKTIVHGVSGLCMTSDNVTVGLQPCDGAGASSNQQWRVDGTTTQAVQQGGLCLRVDVTGAHLTSCVASDLTQRISLTWLTYPRMLTP